MLCLKSLYIEGNFSLLCIKHNMKSLQMIGYYVNSSHLIYISPVRILNSDEFPERQSGKLIMSTVMHYIINLLFTLLLIVAYDKIISHIVIMILIKADLMGKMPKK